MLKLKDDKSLLFSWFYDATEVSLHVADIFLFLTQFSSKVVEIKEQPATARHL